MRGSAGFTIVETLVALAILAVALVIFYGVAGTSLRAVEHVGKVEQAVLLAHSKLDELSSRQDLLPLQSSGRFAGSEFTWTVTAYRLPEAMVRPNAAHLQDVTVSISWREGLNPQTLTVRTRHLGRDET